MFQTADTTQGLGGRSFSRPFTRKSESKSLAIMLYFTPMGDDYKSFTPPGSHLRLRKLAEYKHLWNDIPKLMETLTNNGLYQPYFNKHTGKQVFRKDHVTSVTSNIEFLKKLRDLLSN